MSNRRQLWLRLLWFIGQRRKVVDYLRYHGLTMSAGI